ncbi:adhesive plaque matrix protein-like [Penaeus indicus]|uniref:adhesive plaque matrix protein-like n=1 Tax=Penaeus indicus TaxID=29960 RepID=UPI00300D1D8F
MNVRVRPILAFTNKPTGMLGKKYYNQRRLNLPHELQARKREERDRGAEVALLKTQGSPDMAATVTVWLCLAALCGLASPYALSCCDHVLPCLNQCLHPTPKPTYPTWPPTYPTPRPTWPTYPTYPPTWPTYPTQWPTYDPCPTYPTQRPTWPTYPTYPPCPTYPTQRPTYPTQIPTWPTYPTQIPTWPTYHPCPTYPTQRPTYPPCPTYPTQRPTYPTQIPIWPTYEPCPTYPTQRPTRPTYPPCPTYPTQRPTYPTQRPTYPTQRPTWPTYPPCPTYPTQIPTWPTYPPCPTYPTWPTYPTYPPAKPSPCGHYHQTVCPYAGRKKRSNGQRRCSLEGHCPHGYSCCPNGCPGKSVCVLSSSSYAPDLQTHETYPDRQVNVSIIFTTASTLSHWLLQYQVLPVKSALPAYVSLEQIPSSSMEKGGECQNGGSECLGNMLVSCVARYMRNQSAVLSFASCLTKDTALLKGENATPVLKKALKVGDDWQVVR